MKAESDFKCEEEEEEIKGELNFKCEKEEEMKGELNFRCEEEELKGEFEVCFIEPGIG